MFDKEMNEKFQLFILNLKRYENTGNLVSEISSLAIVKADIEFEEVG